MVLKTNQKNIYKRKILSSVKTEFATDIICFWLIEKSKSLQNSNPIHQYRIVLSNVLFSKRVQLSLIKDIMLELQVWKSQTHLYKLIFQFFDRQKCAVFSRLSLVFLEFKYEILIKRLRKTMYVHWLFQKMGMRIKAEEFLDPKKWL